MIHAVANNRAKRSLFKTDEDALTSSIIERLSYLPEEIFEHIIQKSLSRHDETLDLSGIIEVTFWPKWFSKDTSNKNYVEPDVFIRTSKTAIIIESKRLSKGQQNSRQWENEIRAFLGHFKDFPLELKFIALGGIRNYETEKITIDGTKYTILKCPWENILNIVQSLKNDLENSSKIINSNKAIANILDDILLSFRLFGFKDYSWFESMPKISGPKDSSIQIINLLSI